MLERGEVWRPNFWGGDGSTKLVEACGTRIRALEDRLRAWVSHDIDRAMAEVKSQGAVAGFRSRRPLAGLPIGVKDIIDVAGLPTRAGSPLRENHVATADAPIVARLRAAGAIVLGKTVTTEYACFDPSPTCNPWNPRHTPGGSSSGSAAAVATGMCFAALGSQTGGSITRPAAYCGVCGYKPTWRIAGTVGVVPIAGHLDHVGVLTRHALDLPHLYPFFCDWPRRTDHVHSATGLSRSAREQRFEADATRETPILGILGGFFHEAADSQTRDSMRETIKRLCDGRHAGSDATAIDLKLPASFDNVHAMHRRIMAFEAAQYHRHQYTAHKAAYGKHIAALVEEGLAITPVDYAEALRHQVQFREDMLERFGDCDVLVTPAAPAAAPAGLESTGDPAFNSPWSHTGFPTVCVPCGLTSEGMPLGLQLIGRPHDDLRAIETAIWCEERIEFNSTPPILADLEA